MQECMNGDERMPRNKRRRKEKINITRKEQKKKKA